MTTHSMDEAETLCKRMGIMVNGEFVCLGKANEIKNKYGYGYEIDVRIKPISQINQEEILEKYNWEKNLMVNMDNAQNIFNTMDKSYFIEELKEERLGKRIKKAIDINGGVSIGTIINWIFFVENAMKFIQKGINYFEEIILAEHIENNFLFKMKKGNNTKSIGFFFGLFEESKEECHVTEYSIQQTSLEQIFNKFAANQGKENKEVEENNILEENKLIVIDEALFNNILS
jgi:ABC-type proline/glycine betaine transport system ATPase subunit